MTFIVPSLVQFISRKMFSGNPIPPPIKEEQAEQKKLPEEKKEEEKTTDKVKTE